MAMLSRSIWEMFGPGSRSDCPWGSGRNFFPLSGIIGSYCLMGVFCLPMDQGTGVGDAMAELDGHQTFFSLNYYVTMLLHAHMKVVLFFLFF